MTLTLNKENYLKLLKQTQIIPKIIATEAEYEDYLAVAEKLISHKENRTPEQTTLLRLLVRLIEDYEENYYALQDWSNLSPHEILQHLLESSSTQPADLANIVNTSEALIPAFINGQAEISKEQAKRLGLHFKVSPGLFI